MKRDPSRRCNQEAVPGLNVCGGHGGKTPAAIAAAFTRLGGSVEDAAETVAQIMAETSTLHRDRLAAAAHVTKLLGMEKERTEVTVKVDPIEELFRSIAADSNGLRDPQAPPPPRDPEQIELDRRADVQELAEDGPNFDGLDIVDAELVEDQPTRAKAERTNIDPTPKHIREALENLL
jgi:hypothetical protein